MILKALKKPYPLIFNAYSYLIPSLVTFIFIIFFKPLGFSSIDFFERVIIALVIALIIAISIFFGVKALIKFLPRKVNEDNWTIGKEFLLNVSILGVIIFAISLVLNIVLLYQYENVNFGSIFVATFFRTTKITFGVYIIPIVISILVQQNNFKNKQFIKAKELSKKLEKEISYLKCLKLEQDENILLKSDNKIVELQVKIMNIMFIKSEGNYVEVHYINNGNITKKLIRDRIKNIENILPSHTFIRCHNRYIINKYFVTKVNGNARGLSLELKDYNEIISVSRSKIKAFESFMTKRYRLHSHS